MEDDILYAHIDLIEANHILLCDSTYSLKVRETITNSFPSHVEVRIVPLLEVKHLWVIITCGNLVPSHLCVKYNTFALLKYELCECQYTYLAAYLFNRSV